MKYIDNTQTDKYLLENNKIPERHFFLNRAHTSSKEYLGFHDPDYFSLLKHYTQDSSLDDTYQYNHQSSVTDLNPCSIRHQEFNKVPEKTLNGSWFSQNERPLNSTESLLNASDDEALENYLNDLAKNYDDIDRRIRNAERFVTKMEESQNSNYNSLPGFNHVIPLNNSFGNGDEKSDKKMKYVTELRVNISDNMATEATPYIQDSLLLKDNTCLKFTSSGPRIKHYCEPISRKMSLNYTNSNAAYQSNLVKPKCLTVSTNLNFVNVTSNGQNSKSRASSLSNSVKMDPEYTDIPPPKIFSSNFSRSENVGIEKEIQTTYTGCRSNLFSKYIYEDAAIQTAEVVFQDLKESVDKCVCTETEIYKPKVKPYLESSTAIPNQPCESDIEVSETEKDDAISKSEKVDHCDMIPQNLECDQIQMNAAISNKLSDKKPVRPVPNLPNVQTTFQSKVPKYSNLEGLKIEKTEKRKNSINSVTKLFKMKNPKISPGSNMVREINTNLGKGLPRHTKDLEPEIIDTKDSTRNASLEIQRLLENLGTHLQASMSIKEPRAVLIKSPASTDSSSASFWDNPLHKNDLISAKVTPVKIKPNDSGKKAKKSNNIINSELQAICKTIEKNKIYESRSVNVSNLSISDSEYSDSAPNNIQTLRSESLDNRQIKKSENSPNRPGVIIKKSVSNVNVSGDTKFPSNFKVFRSFELNPYDDIIKAHLSPFDRRVKSVGAKNSCKIVIEGPINSYDPISCQAFRNKVIYRCTVAGPYKENLDKCMNYLKETFPNTFLKVNSKSR